MNKPSWFGFLILCIASIFVVYANIASIYRSVIAERVSAKIIKIDKKYIKFEYFNNTYQKTYIFKREINTEEYLKIISMDTMHVLYNPSHPENVIIEKIDINNGILMPSIITLITIVTVIVSAASLRKNNIDT